MSNGSDNVYLNILIPNNIPSTNPFPQAIQAVYDESLTQPVLADPSKYYASIIRFSMPLDTIPFFSFPLDRSQTNANLSQLLIGITNNVGVDFPAFVTYIPQNDYPPPVTTDPTFSYGQSISPYYFIYSIQPFINMINTALLAAYTASTVGGGAPFYVYNPATQLIGLVVTAGFLATGAKIYMNNYLKNYLDSFPFYSKNSIQTGAYRYTHNLDTLPYGAPVGGPYEFLEEYNSLDLWFDIRKIVVTSSSLPVIPEASPSFVPDASYGTNGSANYSPIVTDFVISYNNINDVSSVLVYEPSPQYRLVNMSSQSPIQRLNFSFFWLSKNGTLYPVFLSPNNSITMKIGFFKKDLYKNS